MRAKMMPHLSRSPARYAKSPSISNKKKGVALCV